MAKSRKIIEIIPALISGGAERFVVDLSNELSLTDEIILVLLFPITLDNFYLNQVSNKVKIISVNKKKGLDFFCLIRIWQLIKREKPDVVHSHLRSINYLILSILLNREIKYFHTVHNDAKKEAGGTISLNIRKLLFRLNLCKPITISKVSQKSFQDVYKMSSILIPNGRSVEKVNNVEFVDKELQSLRLTSNTRIILNIARIEPQKNQYILSKVISDLISEGHDLVLIVIGRKTDITIVREIEDIKSDRIYMLGERKNPIEYIAQCDAFCLSSLYEGMPITLIEAFAAGAIPLCTPVGGIKDMIIDGQNGILAKGINYEDIKEMILQFLNLSYENITRIKKNAKDSYKNYTITQCASSYKKAMLQDE